MSLEERYWETMTRISAHEAMCEERSKTIFNRLESIESSIGQMQRNMFLIGFTLISGMAGLIITLSLG
jgi:hypothetical protein